MKRVFSPYILLFLAFASSAWTEPPANFHVMTVSELAAYTNKAGASQSSTALEQCCANLHGRSIALRGFLYMSSEGDWVLAETPHLKSCCVGASDKASHQVYVEGEGLQLPFEGHAVTLQGQLEVAAVTRDTGELQRLFTLRKASLLPEHNQIHATGLLLFVGLFLAATVFVLTTRVMRP